MPQIENGYLKIANELLDAVIAIRIPGEAMQVFLFIMRKTYGFNKKADCIALSQFTGATGLKRPNVCRAIKKLAEMKLIIVIKKDNSSITEYRVHKVLEDWQPLSKKITLSKKIMNVIKKDNRTLSKKIHTKDNTKDNITKDSDNKKNTVDQDFILKCKENYPAVNVELELQKMKGWLFANPGRQLTRRFAVNWLNRVKPPEFSEMSIEQQLEQKYKGGV